MIRSPVELCLYMKVARLIKLRALSVVNWIIPGNMPRVDGGDRNITLSGLFILHPKIIMKI